MIFHTLKELQKNRKKIEHRIKEFEKVLEESSKENEENELSPNLFYHSLIKMVSKFILNILILCQIKLA